MISKEKSPVVHCMESRKWYSNFGLACAVAWCESNWKCVVHH